MSFIRLTTRGSGAQPAERLGAGVTMAATVHWPVTRLGLHRCQRDNHAVYDVALPLGTVTALVEDEPGLHARTFLSVFIAEGLAHEHSLGLVPGALVEGVPASPVAGPSSSATASASSAAPEADLRIAWRYANKVGSASKRRAERARLDLSLQVNPRELLRSSAALRLYQSLEGALEFAAAPASQQCRRLALQSPHHWVCSQMIGGLSEETALSRLWRFLYILRQRCRKSMTVAVMTLSRQWALNPSLLHLLDAVIDVNTFGGKGVAELGLGAFDGLIHPLKMAVVPSSLKPMTPFIVDDQEKSPLEVDLLVFRRTRRELVVEPAHEAPDLSIPGTRPSHSKAKQIDGVADTLKQMQDADAFATDW